MTSGDAGFEVRLVAVPAAAALIRERLGDWLAGLGWPGLERDDVVLAVHEAVTNSIEHGYAGREPGDVVVTGHALDAGTRVHLVVRDDGRWRTPRDPGYRGRGLPVMRGCMADVDVHGDADGTVVRLRSHSVAPADLQTRRAAEDPPR